MTAICQLQQGGCLSIELNEVTQAFHMRFFLGNEFVCALHFAFATKLASGKPLFLETSRREVERILRGENAI